MQKFDSSPEQASKLLSRKNRLGVVHGSKTNKYPNLIHAYSANSILCFYVISLKCASYLEYIFLRARVRTQITQQWPEPKSQSSHMCRCLRHICETLRGDHGGVRPPPLSLHGLHLIQVPPALLRNTERSQLQILQYNKLRRRRLKSTEAPLVVHRVPGGHLKSTEMKVHLKSLS